MSPNPMMDILSATVPVQNPLAGILNSLRYARNPMAMLQNMALNNPQLKPVFDIIQQNGENAQQAFYAEAKRRGVDPTETLQQAQSMMK